VLHVGCKEKLNSPQSTISQFNSINDSLSSSIVKKFALPYPQNFKLDSNTLIFYGSRPFDTSFLFQLRNEPQEISVVYYEVIPTYHYELNNFSDPANKLLFFEGYSFILDSSKWKEVKDRADRLLEGGSTFDIKEACMDCAIFGLYYGTKSNIGNTTKYSPFYNFLKEYFLDSLIVRRKPIIFKVK
jgi:hypothetical protein